jgi:hypothetical protein
MYLARSTIKFFADLPISIEVIVKRPVVKELIEDEDRFAAA